MPRQAKPDHPMTVRFTATEIKQLETLAKRHGMSRGSVVRQMVRASLKSGPASWAL